MTTYLHDGVRFDLAVTHTDVTGVEWQWSGDWNDAGEPWMGATGRGSVIFLPPLVSLPDLYGWHGPLIPTPRPATAALYRRILRQAAA
ncbi:phiSA1p31-related protein [Streptomyces olivaceus]|uniref:phiSA1p31-related protein n=1 Tax=Streptomyces olivaceus TaxID=47716 RepID=UPI001CCFA689|nr:phiSA1p31-related protein [Streptomyces olivaceus]MBZ6290331.1 phiSA1p31-related protein [Streptomyces olivaceus]MBZ6324283.1 phiSA1p31-related protein [Streptomyces olivaceus]